MNNSNKNVLYAVALLACFAINAHETFGADDIQEKNCHDYISTQDLAAQINAMTKPFSDKPSFVNLEHYRNYPIPVGGKMFTFSDYKIQQEPSIWNFWGYLSRNQRVDLITPLKPENLSILETTRDYNNNETLTYVHFNAITNQRVKLNFSRNDFKRGDERFVNWVEGKRILNAS